MFRKAVEFVFYSSAFLSLCAVAMCVETNLLLHLPLNKPGFYLFIFGGVMVQYNLHYLVKKASHANSSHFQWSQKNRATHFFLTGAGLLLLLAGVLNCKLHHFIVPMVLGIITMLYSFPLLPFAGKKRLKDFGILKIISLVLLWAIITVWFPVSEVSYTGSSGPLITIFITRFVFLFALCLVFDIRDIDIDTRENIKTIPVIMGANKTYNFSYILLGAFIVITLIRYLQSPDLTQLNAMLLSAGSTFFIIGYVKKNKSDIAYLACLDGMMLLQALLIISGSI